MAKAKNLIGEKFGKLTVIEKAERPPTYKDKRTFWKCICECGKTCIKNSHLLLSGKTTSCGCRRQNHNKIKQVENITYIFATGRKEPAIIDTEDYEKIKDYCWHHMKGNYTRTQTVNNGKRITVLLHRLIMGVDPNIQVDHINRNPLDNRKSNLRVSTQQENCFNRSIQKNNSSGYVGVSKDNRSNRWLAFINVNGKRICLGYHKNIEDAIHAREQAEINYFKEFRKSN